MTIEKVFEKMLDNFRLNAGLDSLVFSFRINNKCGKETHETRVQYLLTHDYKFR